MVSNPTLRIARLRTLIDHPRTGDAERAAAQRMLDRILAKPRTPTATDRTYGARHDRLGRHAGLTRIVEMIRDDIDLRRAQFSTSDGSGGAVTADPVGDAPSSIRFEVDAPFDSEIVVTVRSVPTDWGWHHDGAITGISPALTALADELADLMNAYNHIGPETTKRFFGRVRVDEQTLVW